MTTKPKTPVAKTPAAKAVKPVAKPKPVKAKPPAKAKPAAKKPVVAKAPKKPGRPSIYTPEIVDAICDAIAKGEGVATICARAGMPAEKTVYLWLDDPSKAEFLQRYMRAREAQADLLAEQILQIADDGTNDTQKDEDGKVRVDQDVIARSRLRVDARKWLAGKLAPKKYGDKLALGGADDLPPIDVVTKSMTDAERAVRLSRMLNGNPDVLASLVSALKGKA
jgi:hypothetical protein